MRLFLAGTMSVLLVVFCAAGGWAQGNACEENIDAGNGGCGINPQAVQNQSASGGIDFSGSDYDNACATGTGGCTVNQPMMRFWEFDNFDGGNSAVNPQDVDPTYWMVNPALDFAMGSETNRWMFFQANWANSLVQGCPTTGRTVAEVSWCDNGTSQAWYVVGSVPGPAYDFDGITGADTGPGGNDNMMPITAIPLPGLPTPAEAAFEDPFCKFTVTMPAAISWWTDAGAAADPVLIAGYEILYQNIAAAPSPQCETGLGAWMPVLETTGAANLGVVMDGAHDIAVPGADGDRIFVTARIVYADAGTSCAVGNCPDPQGQGTPASCFYEVSAPVLCGDVPVSFDFADAQRLTGNSAKVSWRTSEEYDTFGFKVMRAAAGSGDYQQIGSIVHAQGPGHVYTATDANALRSQSYDYQIVEIAFAGVPSVSEVMHLEGIEGHGKRVRRLPQER